jgi:uncharacterized protein (TIGR03118 family)
MSLRTSVVVTLGSLALALSLSSPSVAQRVVQSNLVSSQPAVANNQDILLRNPIGLARGTGTNWQVSDNGDGLSTSYDGSGNSNFVSVTIAPAVPGPTALGTPTGVVFNGTSCFNYPATTTPAQFLYATGDGTIQAYNANINPAASAIVIDNHTTSSYTGLTIGEFSPGVFYLYAANFKKRTIDVFDCNFKPVSFGGSNAMSAATSRMNSSSSTTVAPYNIQAVGQDLVITIVVKNKATGAIVTGAGKGLVLIISTQGSLRNFLFDSSLNAPYGIAQAGADFGRLSHSILIANTGSGTISAFDSLSGRFYSTVQDPNGVAVVIDGLHSLGFGATGAAGDPSFSNQQSGAFNSLYFTAGPNGGVDGLVGNLTPISGDFVIGEQ